MTSNSSNKPSVFIIDDDAIVLEALNRTVQSLGVTTKTFTTPAPCIKALRNEDCDILITDVNMPEMNGIELVVRAKEMKPFLPILVITGFADIPLAIRAVKSGATEFLEKPLDENQFLPLLKKMLEDNPLNTSAQPTLTDVERAVLKLVAKGKSNKEIAYQLDKSIRTVENQRHRLSKKLNAPSTAELVKIAIEIGLISVR